MTNSISKEQHVGEMLSGYLDNELTQQDRQRVHLHCEKCDECGNQLTELRSLRQATGAMHLSDIKKDAWREHMNDTTVKASRSIGWLLFIGGILIAAGLGIYEFIRELDSIPTVALLIIVGVYGGLLLLFVSVLRQRLVERKTDKFKDVEI